MTPMSFDGQLRRSSTRFVPARMRLAYFGLIDSSNALPLGWSEDSGKRLIVNMGNGLNRAGDDTQTLQLRI